MGGEKAPEGWAELLSWGTEYDRTGDADLVHDEIDHGTTLET